MPTIDEATFKKLLQGKLGGHWERAREVFRNCGPNLAWDVANVLLHAAGKGKVAEVLGIIEKHWKEHLQFQHPEIRGRVANLGVNPTEVMFLGICRDTLELQPNAG
jgi:hypothetical protein